jgi:hypothetical protein
MIFGQGPETLTIAGVVSSEWRHQRVLAHARAKFRQGKLIPIEHTSQLERLSAIHKPFLTRHGIDHLVVSQIRSRQRDITQAFSRTLFEEGHAGILFRSRLDIKPCYAFFEGRASLHMIGKPIPMTTNHPDLIRVCGEYTLVLRPA